MTLDSSHNKAIVAVIMGVAFLLNSWFHVTIPGFLTPDNLNQALAIIGPILVYLIPNKVTTAQKTEVLATVGVTPAQAASGTIVIPASTAQDLGISPISHLQ